jgi:uncharacterized protein Yka (UPF0111/DUF47 family)
MKSRISEHLGHAEIILPSLVADGLAGNDRAKVRMSALQAAAQHACNPTSKRVDLSAECRAAGVDEVAVQSLVGDAQQVAGGAIAAPQLSKAIDALLDDVRMMIRAASVGDVSAGRSAADRLASIIGRIEHDNDRIDLDAIATLTALPRDDSDSLHRLVMDLHKCLNRLAASCAEEVVAGAHAFGIDPDDRPQITAFMRGVDRTRALKFDHPGLDTTATRSGSRLLIQNDIGTTDAHVLVVSIEHMTVTVTYSDVHEERAKFFIGLFDSFAARWSDLSREKTVDLGKNGVFYLATGRYAAEGAEQREAFLEAIGVAIVFLIDWNKARKALRVLAGERGAVHVLDWAARQRVGHRAYLELGGNELVASAIRRAAPSRIGFGEQLETVLGREAAVDFLKTTLRVCTECLLEGRSVRRVRDAIEADLLRRLERTHSDLLTIIVRQAGLAREIAADIASHVAEQRAGRKTDADALAARARRIEEKADRITIDARNEVARFNSAPTIERMVNQIEEAVDELEQAAFIVTLVPGSVEPAALAPLADLCAAAIAGAEAVASGVAAAAEVPEGRRADFEDALAAASRLIDIEHAADAAERTVTALVLREGFDLPTSISLLELSRSIERATDQLAACGHLLRAHVIAHLAA